MRDNWQARAVVILAAIAASRLNTNLGVVALSAFFPLYAMGGGFTTSYGSDHEKLKDHKIIAVGSLFQKSGPQDWMQSSSGKTRLLYQLYDHCFFLDQPLEGNAALLLVDKFGQSKVAILTPRNSEIKVTLTSISVSSCAEINRDANRLMLDEVKNMQEWSKRQKLIMEDLEKQIKELERKK